MRRLMNDDWRMSAVANISYFSCEKYRQCTLTESIQHLQKKQEQV